MYEIEDCLIKQREREKRRYSSFKEFRKQRNEEAVIAEEAEKHEKWKRKKEQMERKYLKGFYVKKKQSKYGSFYKASIKYDDFINNLVPNDKGYVNFCIFENKEGEPYAVLDEYTTTPKDDEIKKFDDEDKLLF